MSGGMPDSRLLSRHLGAITRAIRIHDVSNQAVSRLIGWSARDLTKLSADSMDARVEVDVAGVLVVNNIPQRLNRENRTQLLPLAAMLRKVDAGGFAISGPVSPGQLLALFSAIHDAVPGKSRAAVQSLIDGGAVSPLQLIGPRVLISGMVGGPGDAVRLAASESLQAYIRANLAVHTALAEGVLTRIPPAVFRSVQALADLADTDIRMHLALTCLKADVDYEIRHPVHSMILAMALGARLGLPRVLLVELGLAALLAATLPADADADDILSLVVSMIQGPRLSLSRARRMLALFDVRAGFDRTGPPHLPLDSPPHLFARLVAIAVAFDALTTAHGDSPGLLADEALAQMGEASGIGFDPELLSLFALVIGRYPLGTALLLNTGEVGIVVHTQSDPALANRPLVRIVRDAAGRDLANGVLVDLADPTCGSTVTVRVDAHVLGIDAARAIFS